MSLSYTPLEPVLVRDPITLPMNTRQYAVLKGGNQVTWKRYTTTNISNSSITWSCPPPSGNVFVDSKMYCLLPVRLVFTATGALSGNLLNPGNDAPRAFPLSGSIETMQCSINGQSFSIFMSDIIHPMTHYNTGEKLHNKDYSLTPTYYDQSQSYADLQLSTRNPLGGYQNGLDHSCQPRGGFPFTIVQNTPTQAVVDMVLCEPLFISPYYFGSGDAPGFYNVTTLDYNFTFLTNANRFWSHNQLATSNPIANIQAYFSNFTSAFATPFSYTENQPILLFKYITPDETQVLSPNMPLTYPYYDVQRYPLDFPSAVTPGVANTTGQISSNNLQLNSIPRMMYVFARTRNNDLYTPGSGCSFTDTYLALENINITFANYTGLLSSASKYQLYQIASKNGSGMSWTQWSGERENNASNWTTPVAQYGTIGSIMAIEFATDLGLPSDMCPGIQGQFQLQVNCQFKNTSNNNINASLYIIIVSEGSMTIPGLNSCTKQLGVITKQDVLNAKSQPGVNYDDIRDSLYGGEGNWLSNINRFLKSSKVISTVASRIPHPIAQTVGAVARMFGYGEGEGEGEGEGGIVLQPDAYHGHGSGEGVSVGGRRLTRKELRRKLR